MPVAPVTDFIASNRWFVGAANVGGVGGLVVLAWQSYRLLWPFVVRAYKQNVVAAISAQRRRVVQDARFASVSEFVLITMLVPRLIVCMFLMGSFLSTGLVTIIVAGVRENNMRKLDALTDHLHAATLAIGATGTVGWGLVSILSCFNIIELCSVSRRMVLKRGIRQFRRQISARKASTE